MRFSVVMCLVFAGLATYGSATQNERVKKTEMSGSQDQKDLKEIEEIRSELRQEKVKLDSYEKLPLAQRNPAVLREMGETNATLRARLDVLGERYPPGVELKQKVAELDIKDSLIKLRKAVLRYDDDHHVYPKRLEDLVPQYLSSIPRIPLEYHLSAESQIHNQPTATVDDSGGWIYVTDESSSYWGKVLINCTHLDAFKKRWDGL